MVNHPNRSRKTATESAEPELTDIEAAEAFSKWHAYSESVTGGRVHLVQPWDGKNKGKPLCRGSVHNDYGVGFHQCTKPGIERSADGLWWCYAHGPTGFARRKVEQERRWREKRAAEEAARRRALLANPHVQALLKIARGDNDPRATALEALGPLMAELDGDA